MTSYAITSHTKEIIVRLLSSTDNLTAKQIHNRLQREFGFVKTYQATHKTLKEMIGQGILAKKGANYSVNQEWVENFRKEAEHLAEKVKNKSTEFNLDDLADNESVHLSFKGIPEVGWFLVDKILNGPNPRKKYCLALWRFCYSIVGLESKHLTRLKDGFRKNRWIALVEQDGPVDRMFGKTLEGYGLNDIRFGKKCATKLSDKMIVGDYIAEIIYPSTFRKLWEIQNRLPKKIAEFNLSKHFLYMRELQPQIEVIITKNDKMAEEYRMEYMTSSPP